MFPAISNVSMIQHQFACKIVANLNKIGESKPTQNPENKKNFLNVKSKNPVKEKLKLIPFLPKFHYVHYFIKFIDYCILISLHITLMFSLLTYELVPIRERLQECTKQKSIHIFWST